MSAVRQPSNLSHEAALFVSGVLAELEDSANEATYRQLMADNNWAGAYRGYSDPKTQCRYQFELARSGAEGGWRYEWRYRYFIRSGV